MKHISSLILTAAAMFLFASSSFAEVPANPHFTPMSLMPRPFAASSTFDVAGIYWLPDYLGKNISRGSEDMGGGDIDGECETYGYVSECNAPKTSGGMIYPISGLACHKSCSCSGNFQYTSSNCSGKYKLSGNSCDGKYSDCVCNDTFIYDASNCNGENKLGGEICNGKYNSCTLRPECTVPSKDCTYGCAEYNSCDRCTSCKPNPDCDVSDKSCTYGCAATNSCGKCTECKSCTPSANETGCIYGTESCSDGCGGTRLCCKGHSHSYSCPAGYQSSTSGLITPVAVSKTCFCGAISGSCYKEGHTLSYSCPSGSQEARCLSSQIQVGTKSKVCSCGATTSDTCYVCNNCRGNPTCPSYSNFTVTLYASNVEVPEGPNTINLGCGYCNGPCFYCSVYPK